MNPNGVPGYYWVYQHKGDQFPSIARLTKQGGWTLMADKHSYKMVKYANSPYKVLYRILEPIMENTNEVHQAT